MTTQETITRQKQILHECFDIVNTKGICVNIYKGIDDAKLQELISDFDGKLKDLAIELLQSIPYEEEKFCMMPEVNLSNCKPLGDITTFTPINAVELAELLQEMKNKTDNSNATKGDLGLT